MKPSILSAAFLAAVAAGCGGNERVAPAIPGDKNAPLVLVTTGETPPYSYRDEETGNIVGVEIDIAREAAARLGRALEVRIAKFPELLPMVSEGKADLAASGITIAEGRLQTVDFSAPYATEGGMFLYRADAPTPTMPSANRLRIAVMDASTYDFYLSAHGIDPIRFGNFHSAFEAFRERRVDTVFYDSCTVRLVAEQSGGEFRASRLETRETLGIAVGKGNSSLKAALDAAIAARRPK